jgi:hypothetical protein
MVGELLEAVAEVWFQRALSWNSRWARAPVHHDFVCDAGHFR